MNLPARAQTLEDGAEMNEGTGMLIFQLSGFCRRSQTQQDERQTQRPDHQSPARVCCYFGLFKGTFEASSGTVINGIEAVMVLTTDLDNSEIASPASPDDLYEVARVGSP